MNPKSYLKLIRLRFSITYATVIFAAIVTSQNVTIELLKSIIVLYPVFNILLYGGLYTINAIADADTDSSDTAKKKRPIPSGEVTKKQATTFAAILIATSIMIAYAFFGPKMAAVFLAFIALNLFYTYLAKKTPYLDMLTATSTHSLRFLLGAMLAGGTVPYPVMISHWLAIVSIGTAVRATELQFLPYSKPILKHYSMQPLKAVSAAATILAAAITFTNTQYFGINLALLSASAVGFGIHISTPARKLIASYKQPV
ncbi:UbiA family prenyltransferase [Candidatus Woesearchaeota archaeon]|nr:UbiA family prenyltransferase [Candidatus Woesearchaeota archaeon]